MKRTVGSKFRAVYVILFFWTPKIGIIHLFLHGFHIFFFSGADFPVQRHSSPLYCNFLLQVYGIFNFSLPTRSLVRILPVNSSSTVCLVTPVKRAIVNESLTDAKTDFTFDPNWTQFHWHLQIKLIRDLWTFPYKLMLIEAKQLYRSNSHNSPTASTVKYGCFCPSGGLWSDYHCHRWYLLWS